MSTHEFKPHDLVLLRYKRGAKLAEVIASPGFNAPQYLVKVWNAAGQKWGSPTARNHKDIMVYATPSELRSFYYRSPAAVTR